MVAGLINDSTIQTLLMQVPDTHHSGSRTPGLILQACSSNNSWKGQNTAPGALKGRQTEEKE